MELSVFNRLEERIDNLLGELRGQRSRIEELSAALSEKEREVDRLNQEMASQAAASHQKLEQAQSEMSQLKEVLDAREDERQEVKRRVEQLVLKLENQP